MKTVVAILLVAGFATSIIGSYLGYNVTVLNVAGWVGAISYFIAYESEKSK